MKHILFVFIFVFGCIMPTMVYAQANGGVHTITRGGSKTKPGNNSGGLGNSKKKKPTKSTTTTTPSSKTTTKSTTPSSKTTATTSPSSSISRDQILSNLVANMVYVEGGTLTMGSDAYNWEKPMHEVTLSSFFIGKYEVTQEEWEAVMGSNPSFFKGAKHPVEQVSWEDCQTFIRKLNQLTGRNFRLPTEAEWEYTARGGCSSQGYKYAGTTNNLDDYAWYDELGGDHHPVGQKNANELGLYDMSGNVWEWCADWDGKYSWSSQTNPQGPSSGSRRVSRGGCYFSSADQCSVSFRGSDAPSSQYDWIGLRLVLSSENIAKTSTTSSRDQILNNLVANMVYVEGGTFSMGFTFEQGKYEYVSKDEKRIHKVTLSSFSIGKYEVTQEEWDAVMGSNPSHFQGAKRPVECVSWEDCQTFIRKLNQLTGRNFRLPTEAEWEYAARGGRSGRGHKYAGTTEAFALYAWIHPYSKSTTHPVGQKNANELGLYDMTGNVWEWCADWYGSYSKSAQTNPQGPNSGSRRVCRGGSLYDSSSNCRVSDRSNEDPSNRMNSLGLRLAL